MGSITNFLDRGQQERDNLNFVIEDGAISVDVYRRTQQGGSPGLTAQVHEPDFLRTINVRLDAYRSRSTVLGKSRIRLSPIGLTNDTDVRTDDLWRWTDVANHTRWYRVASVSRTQSTSSAVLEEIKR